jgi:hypothetical protein
MELNVVVQLVKVPVGAAHLKPTFPRLSVGKTFAVADDVREVVTAGPMLWAGARIPLHGVRSLEIIPGAHETDASGCRRTSPVAVSNFGIVLRHEIHTP